MTYILVHGLGQDASSWNSVIEHINIEAKTPDLFALLKGNEYSFQELYRSFRDYLDNFNDKLDICGLSLGG